MWKVAGPALLLAISTGLGLTGCQTAGSSTPSTSSPPSSSAATVPGAPAGDRLQEVMANTSLRGQNIANEPFCSYYAPDGGLLRTTSGVVETGTWSVDGRFVCETVGGVQGCMTLDFLPLGGVTVTLADGSGGFSYPAQSIQGNSCG